MKKIILLLTILIMLTGCSVNYELTISKDKAIENITLQAENANDNEFIMYDERPIEAFVNSPTYSETNEKIDGVEYYNITKNLNNEYYTMNLKYDFKLPDLKDSYLINYSVSSFHIDANGSELSYYTGSNIKAFKMYNGISNLTIRVNVSDEFEIVESNANKVIDHTLIWEVNQNNYTNSPINFTIKDITSEALEKEENNYENPNQSSSENGNENENENQNVTTDQKDENKDNSIFIVVGVLLGFCILLVIVINIKRFKR